jgi:hypothetical protein
VPDDARIVDGAEYLASRRDRQAADVDERADEPKPAQVSVAVVGLVGLVTAPAGSSPSRR